jgi:hypothetical protein
VDKIVAMDAQEVLPVSPKSYANLWSESGDRGLDFEELTHRLFIPSAQALIGGLHRSDRCSPLLGFGSGERAAVFPCL